MIICNAETHTHLGVAHCHQPEDHRGRGSDCIAITDDPDGELVVIAWQASKPSHVDIRYCRRTVLWQPEETSTT